MVRAASSSPSLWIWRRCSLTVRKSFPKSLAINAYDSHNVSFSNWHLTRVRPSPVSYRRNSPEGTTAESAAESRQRRPPDAISGLLVRAMAATGSGLV